MLGIDISSTAVKLLELSQEGDRYKVENYAITTLPNDTSIGDSDNRPSAIGDQIRAICDRLNTRSKQAAAAVPSSSSMRIWSKLKKCPSWVTYPIWALCLEAPRIVSRKPRH